ncbi:putative metallophosphoesterase At3g03305 [Impatiens glandulifera]|uniref:putative metallophosphoesterase At3g03305 n=1 Tax=Impatiens glandulifera TaxID=253017 RepID=UPI001FB05530|nr:putative metallophosphoesterase At3g03305 [Impatiens glandulifera]
MGFVFLIFSLLLFSSSSILAIHSSPTKNSSQHRRRRNVENIYISNPKPMSDIINVVGGPDDIVWVVQLSDLHFSVHNPERADDFKEMIGPALSMINPSLVLVTGDLTDGKSKDLLTMKQDEKEWKEYQHTLEDVIKRSGLDENIFYDLKGNHDNFGMPSGGISSSDFYSKYSINSQLGRTGQVNSFTLENGIRKVLLVGFDSAMAVELRGPTNLFGHPTDNLLNEIDSKLSQWDEDDTSIEPVTKIVFGHFPLSFSAATESKVTLKEVFLNQSISAYVCGHLHTRFGKNLKRHHYSTDSHLFSSKTQNNARSIVMDIGSKENCSERIPPPNEFWEWEMGDWRTSRVMRVLAVDRGQVSFLDIDFQSGHKKIIVFPTFPQDSRFMLTSSSLYQYTCSDDLSSYSNIRALVFSASPITNVTVKIFDSKSESGNLITVMKQSMTKSVAETPRGNLYTAPWNFTAFEDPSPDRFWLQIEAIDIKGHSTMTELRPFSINGISCKFSWTWKEFSVMGCQWDALYHIILWTFYIVVLSILIVPKVFFPVKKMQYSLFKNFKAEKTIGKFTFWILSEIYAVPFVWLSMLGYLVYLILFPWLYGRAFSDEMPRGYMTFRGWVLKSNIDNGNTMLVGSPDILVVVLPHLLMVVLPSIVLSVILSAEKTVYLDYVLSRSSKRENDDNEESIGCGGLYESGENGFANGYAGGRWIRKILYLASAAILMKHFKNCRALVKAYEMNPLVHFPIYSFFVPILLAHVIYKTMRAK